MIKKSRTSACDFVNEEERGVLLGLNGNLTAKGLSGAINLPVFLFRLTFISGKTNELVVTPTII